MFSRYEVWQGDESTLDLTLEHTFYAHFLATNLNLQPRDRKPHQIKQRIEEMACDDRLTRHAFLASPLNVLAGVVSSDGVLFAPRRGKHVKERPNTLQTSVGGFWEWGDQDDPLLALQREAKEELGLAVGRGEVEFVAFGFNGQTGEPDLLAVVHSPRSRQEVYDGWLSVAEGDPTGAEVSLAPERDALELNLKDPADGDLMKFIKWWRDEDDWSQPSDRAVVLATLSRYVDHDLLKQAFTRTVGRNDFRQQEGQCGLVQARGLGFSPLRVSKGTGQSCRSERHFPSRRPRCTSRRRLPGRRRE
jgi:8-oxo-dGTP pyrophosphatase MutT (NUDIX family)